MNSHCTSRILSQYHIHIKETRTFLPTSWREKQSFDMQNLMAQATHTQKKPMYFSWKITYRPYLFGYLKLFGGIILVANYPFRGYANLTHTGVQEAPLHLRTTCNWHTLLQQTCDTISWWPHHRAMNGKQSASQGQRVMNKLFWQVCA